jgi:hypothetical protein
LLGSASNLCTCQYTADAYEGDALLVDDIAWRLRGLGHAVVFVAELGASGTLEAQDLGEVERLALLVATVGLVVLVAADMVGALDVGRLGTAFIVVVVPGRSRTSIAGESSFRRDGLMILGGALSLRRGLVVIVVVVLLLFCLLFLLALLVRRRQIKGEDFIASTEGVGVREPF